eukprot:m.56466 g.56466  ORF g.56466 m.56466 type:complete len:189 (+) comp13686_c1_seq3:237-803(+)
MELPPSPSRLKRRAEDMPVFSESKSKQRTNTPSTPKLVIKLNSKYSSSSQHPKQAASTAQPAKKPKLEDKPRTMITSAVQRLVSQAKDAAAKRCFKDAISLMDRALQLAPRAVGLQLQQALYQRLAGKPGEAERTAAAVLRDDGMHAQALYVRGVCLYDRVRKQTAFSPFLTFLYILITLARDGACDC